MHRLLLKTSVITILLICVNHSQSYPLSERNVPVTRNLLGTPSPTRLDYLSTFPESELYVHNVQMFRNHRDEEGTVVIAVNHGLLESLEELFDQYASDVADEGFDVILLDTEGGTPAEFKDLLIETGGEDLVGVVLAGELPLAWFEHYEYFSNEDEPDNQILIEYPIDLFFMDIDGTWQDTSGNGIYDVHSDSWEPDIWIGRLPAYNLSRIDEEELIAAYLERVHAYRSGELSLPHRALNFIDDDWIYWADEWGNDVGLTFGLVMTEKAPETTSVAGYVDELEGDGYELVQVAVHSTADTHQFRIDNNTTNDYFRFWHLRDDTIPNVMFYNLFACSNMNLSGNLCMGALYALGGPYGLGAVGSTKTGSMLFFYDYYSQLVDGKNFGEALRLWFTAHGQEPQNENWARSWFYGMTHYGDPTLKLQLGLRLSERIIIEDIEGDDDGNADAGEMIYLVLMLGNLSGDSIEDIELTLESNDQFIHLIDSTAHVGAAIPDEYVTVEGLSLEISENCPDGYKAELICTMDLEDGETWYGQVVLDINSPKILPVSFSYAEIEGNGDGWTGPGEIGELFIFLKNIGGDDLRGDSRIEISSLDGYLEVLDGDSILPEIAPDSVGSSQPVRYAVADEAVELSGVLLQAVVSTGEIVRGQGVILLPIAAEIEFVDEFDSEPVWMNSYTVSDGFNNRWRWGVEAGDGSGGIAFGEPDSTLYFAHSDGAFELPLTMLEDDVVIELHHRMAAEEHYDGGLIEVNRGNGWETAVPVGGYSGYAQSNGSFPGGACWNGVFDWRNDRIEIHGQAGSIRIRLRFFADNAIEMEGWFIDAIGLNGRTYEVKEIVPELAADFRLEEIYPNPFNSSFRGNFSVSRPGRITLKMFDIRGREVEVLIDGHRDVGRHAFSYNGSDLSAGVYLLRMESEELIDTIKLLHLK
ncbi:T9SS type A sorting domain-containing protein [bacterium]|nr:T9SS type A sorting domain-containing protein [bacterium]